MYYIILMEVQGTNLCKLSIYCQISGLILFFNRAHVSSWQFDQENRTLWNLPWASTLTQLWELVESPSLKSLQAGRAGSQGGKLDAKWGRVGANTLELKKRTNWNPRTQTWAHIYLSQPSTSVTAVNCRRNRNPLVLWPRTQEAEENTWWVQLAE